MKRTLTALALSAEPMSKKRIEQIAGNFEALMTNDYGADATAIIKLIRLGSGGGCSTAIMTAEDLMHILRLARAAAP
jgi:hypothetical protein